VLRGRGAPPPLCADGGRAPAADMRAADAAAAAAQAMVPLPTPPAPATETKPVGEETAG
jgi:hypothetical protein